MVACRCVVKEFHEKDDTAWDVGTIFRETLVVVVVVCSLLCAFGQLVIRDHDTFSPNAAQSAIWYRERLLSLPVLAKRCMMSLVRYGMSVSCMTRPVEVFRTWQQEAWYTSNGDWWLGDLAKCIRDDMMPGGKTQF